MSENKKPTDGSLEHIPQKVKAVIKKITDEIDAKQQDKFSGLEKHNTRAKKLGRIVTGESVDAKLDIGSRQTMELLRVSRSALKQVEGLVDSSEARLDNDGQEFLHLEHTYENGVIDELNIYTLEDESINPDFVFLDFSRDGVGTGHYELVSDRMAWQDPQVPPRIGGMHTHNAELAEAYLVRDIRPFVYPEL
jgi:hypothetical protein